MTVCKPKVPKVPIEMKPQKERRDERESTNYWLSNPEKNTPIVLVEYKWRRREFDGYSVCYKVRVLGHLDETSEVECGAGAPLSYFCNARSTEGRTFNVQLLWPKQRIYVAETYGRVVVLPPSSLMTSIWPPWMKYKHSVSTKHNK